ncbi:MAG TPA: hypothetical protein VGI68_05660 [Mycobacterium sp.]|jgi:hypothetical protein
MNLREAREASLNALTPDADASSVYGEPYETADGATVIAVTKVLGLKAKPVGDFVHEVAPFDHWPIAGRHC